MAPTSSRRDWKKIGQVLKRLVLFLLLAAIGTGGFVLEEKWRGARDWKRIQAHLQERGILLDLDPIPESPEIQAFRQLPLIRELYGTPEVPGQFFPRLYQLEPVMLTSPYASYWFYDFRSSSFHGKTLDWQEALDAYHEHAGDFGVNPDDWKGMSSPEIVLSLLKSGEPILVEFESYPHPEGWNYCWDQSVDYSLKAARVFYFLSQYYALRGHAHLEMGQEVAAFADLQRLHHVLQIAAKHGDTQTFSSTSEAWHGLIWEGSRRDAWAVSQWKLLEEQLQTLDLQPIFSMQINRRVSSNIRSLDRRDRDPYWRGVLKRAYPKRKFDWYTFLTNPSQWKQGWPERPPSWPVLMNSGWYDQNKVTLAMGLEILRDAFASTVQHRKAMKLFEYTNWPQSREDPFNVTRWKTHSFLAELNGAIMDYRVFCQLEMRRILALAAVRCHLYHQETGKWPQSLAEVLPTTQPRLFQDLFAAGPIQYLPPADPEGKPKFYSVGWDGVDNSGAIYDDMIWFDRPRTTTTQ